MTTPPVLSAEDHEHFVEHGFVIVRNAVPQDTLKAAVEWLEAGKPEGVVGTPGFKGVGGELVKQCQSDRMLDAIEELFGSHYTFKRSRGGSEMPRPYDPDADWPEPSAHVDDSYPGIMPNGWAVGSFTFLTRVQSKGGAFIYFDGSPLRYRVELAKSCQGAKGIAGQHRFSGPGQEFLAEPGDVLLFQQLMGHAGSTNVSDPQTRQALLSRWHPLERIVPGRKSFDEMSTIEKAYSARYLAFRFGVELNIPAPTEIENADEAVAHGFIGAKKVLAAAMLHFNARVNVLYVDADSPDVIRHACTEDFVNWHESKPLTISGEAIHSLQLHHYDPEVILTVCFESKTMAYQSIDFGVWEELGELDAASCATPFYIYAEYPSKIAGGQSVYHVKPQARSELVCRWGPRWDEIAAWTNESLAATTPDGSSIRDMCIAARFADSQCAIVMDVETSESESTEPYLVLPKDIAVAEEPAEPLNYDCPSSPCFIRVLNRGRRYWLVTYFRRHADEDRLFWGYIDWQDEPPVLKEISTAAGLEEALCVVGFI